MIVAAALTVVVAALSPEIGLAVLLALMPLRLPFYGTSSDSPAAAAARGARVADSPEGDTSLGAFRG